MPVMTCKVQAKTIKEDSKSYQNGYNFEPTVCQIRLT